MVACRTLNLCGREKPARERHYPEQVQRLIHLDQNGMLEGVWFPNARRVVTNPAGVEQAATGSTVCTSGMWEVLRRFPRGNVGSRGAKMPASGEDVGGGIVAKGCPVMGQTG